MFVEAFALVGVSDLKLKSHMGESERKDVSKCSEDQCFYGTLSVGKRMIQGKIFIRNENQSNLYYAKQRYIVRAEQSRKEQSREEQSRAGLSSPLQISGVC